MLTNMDESEVLETPAEEVELEEAPEEDIEALKAKAAKADELEKKNKQLFERLKKQQEEKPKETSGLSIGDTLYLAKADIHEEDVQDVLNYAEKMGVTVKDAHTYFKPVLKARGEERQSALATQTGKGNRAPSAVAPDALLRKAEDGDFGKEDDIDKLVEARMNQRTK